MRSFITVPTPESVITRAGRINNRAFDVIMSKDRPILFDSPESERKLKLRVKIRPLPVSEYSFTMPHPTQCRSFRGGGWS